MRKKVVIPVLFLLVALLALVQLAGANSSAIALAQATTATAMPTGGATAEGTTAAAGTPTPLPPPNRGCLACHVQIDPDGRYTLAWEAMNAMKEQGKEHPAIPMDTKLETCLSCHNGNIAKEMSSIVHPAHMFSLTFSEEFRGNCFSCHEIANEKFTVLVDKQNVNAKGVIEPAATGTVTGTVTAGTPAATSAPAQTTTTTP